MRRLESAAVEDSLLHLLSWLAGANYRFVTPTPTTHRRFIERHESRTARDVRDVFGWNLSFAPSLMPDTLFAALDGAGLIERIDGRFRSAIRVASFGSCLFVHSAFPTDGADSVFFGPDSYRFARLILDRLPADGKARLIDVGGGSGIGAIVALKTGRAGRALLTDTNPTALRLARINAAHNAVALDTRLHQGVPDESELDLVVMNPPYLIDAARRAYRHGGGVLGAKLSVDWALSAAHRLAPGGRALLYSGSAIIEGADMIEHQLRAGLPSNCTLSYHELDPDVFGEELEGPDYVNVERIAAIAALIKRTTRDQAPSRA